MDVSPGRRSIGSRLSTGGALNITATAGNLAIDALRVAQAEAGFDPQQPNTLLKRAVQSRANQHGKVRGKTPCKALCCSRKSGLVRFFPRDIQTFPRHLSIRKRGQLLPLRLKANNDFPY